MDLSIIIPAYNSEKYLSNCLNSIIYQNPRDIEVIIINDGSTDNTASIANEFSKKYSFINVFHQKNLGVSAARNFGIELAKGNYILFLDADDVFYPDLLNTLKEKTNKIANINLISFGYEEENNKNGKLKSYKNLDLNLSILPGNVFTKLFLSKKVSQHVCSFCYKKEMLETYNIKFNTEIHLGEDIAFQIKCMSVADSVLYLSEIYYRYCYNSSSITKSIYSNKHLTCTENFTDVHNFLILNKKYSLDKYLKFYYQFIFFYELREFIRSNELLKYYLYSDDILVMKNIYPVNKSGFLLLIMKFVYNIDKRLLINILKSLNL